MFRIDKYNVNVTIDLENGVYTFENLSASGKTRLAKLFSKWQAYGEPVASYTYIDKLRNISLHDILFDKDIEVVVLDRYDMYKGFCSNEVIQVAGDKIILIDCKSETLINIPIETCFIEMSEHSIEVN